MLYLFHIAFPIGAIPVTKAKEKPAKKETKPKGPHERSMKTIFAYEYLKDPQLNQTNAAIRAGYSEKSATMQASILMQDPHVKEIIQKHMDDRAAAAQITAAGVLKEIHNLAHFKIEDVLEWNGNSLTVKSFDQVPPEARKAIKSIEQIPTKYGDRLKITFIDKEKMLELLGRHLVLFEKKGLVGDDDTPPPTRIEVVVKDARRPE